MVVIVDRQQQYFYQLDKLAFLFCPEHVCTLKLANIICG